MKTTSVALLGDHALVRAGMRLALQNIKIRVIGDTNAEEEAIKMMQAHRGNTILMYLANPRPSHLQSIHRIRKKSPDTPILIVSLQPNEEYAWQALQAGVTGYLQNDAELPELETAIRAVSRGQTYLCRSISQHVVGKYVRQKNQDVLSEKITPRQQQILQLVVEGLSTREIAQRLEISVRTVETHRFHLMERLGIRNIAGLVRFAMQSGLVKPTQE